MRLPRARSALGVALVGLVTACGEAPDSDARPRVAVSVVPLSFFVDRLAGDRVRTHVMIPPGANPATFEPSFAELRAVATAALYVKVGHPSFVFETTRLEGLLAERPGLRIVDASAGFDVRAGDPHVWLAPDHARAFAVRLAAALEELRLARPAELRTRLATLLAEIDALDAEIRDLLAPKRGGRFLVHHPAWGYFAQAYGLEQVAIERDGKEPDARRVAELVQQARQDGVRIVFAQPQFDTASARLIASELGARVELLDPLAYDWTANLRHVARRIAEGATP
ncbi:MAG: zinc ABC transporter substrate-binding protein [Deltaproteobacteria bacterium]|nr:MAG: zinc ABC transporter substrate-binding protein [Deltaproteobacteria bacterium]